MSSRGITLLELLLVLVVVGVLAALALPAYQRHVMRVNRTEATVALYALLAAQERFHLFHGGYASSVTAAPPAGLGLGAISDGGRYSITVALSGDGQSFIATATPTSDGSQASDTDCLAFSIDHRGRRAVSGTAEPASCWR
jgi:type IV pilus assembly protein PilE